MSEPIAFLRGETLTLKKPHPCGSYQWEVVRLGMDIGIRCQGCQRSLLLTRRELERRLRGRTSPTPATARCQPGKPEG